MLLEDMIVLDAASIYRRFADEGGAGQDFSAIINTIRANSEEAA